MSNLFTFLQKIYFSFLYFYNRLTLSLRGAKVGNNLEVFTSFLTQDATNVTIGDNVLIGRDCRFYAANGIVIGNDVMIANTVSLISVDHEFSDKKRPMNAQGLHLDESSIVIGDDVLIGDKVVVLKKVKIGKGSIIGAGSVVTKDIPPYSIAAGNPAIVVKKR
jgi:acetyltransferase-like isoleucine patch superfamily enzyme